ncbi:F0F1 ATP synthase subunit A [Dictyobacter arantiisoli]|uniref:ATP synthase subunit a n=1 Tax=Dictyobacter arantiisoli TaxID=2014874 RepID=A0A5A5TEN0_9CHLR|nr:F0F1 ATP synthase subunit A [Dictyobacter arantiisoli]GCF09364.1 ATP synthase subunit a [Dictyobacter arantiisoli]
MNLWKLPNISIAPDIIIPGTWITNTLLCTWISIIILLVVFYFGIRRQDLVPSGLQNAIEWVVEFLQNLIEGVAGKEKGKKFFPLVATFFIFILFCNLLDIIPGIDTIGTIDVTSKSVGAVHGPLLWGAASNQLIPWLRPATTDLNLTLAMALVSVVATQIVSFSMLGFKDQISKYLNFKAIKEKGGMGFVDFLVGILEIISEFGRLISFSFRLFGNVFAGSVLLAVFAYLLPVVADIVFIPFELFVAVIQAFVFAFLTLLFMQVGTTSHSHSDENVHEAVHEYEENAATAH